MKTPLCIVAVAMLSFTSAFAQSRTQQPQYPIQQPRTTIAPSAATQQTVAPRSATQTVAPRATTQQTIAPTAATQQTVVPRSATQQTVSPSAAAQQTSSAKTTTTNQTVSAPNSAASTSTVKSGKTSAPVSSPTQLSHPPGSSTASPPATTTKSTAPTSSASNGSPYTVKSGDTLANIAASHNMTALQLWALNPQIKDPTLIYPGESVKFSASPTTQPSIASTGSTPSANTQVTSNNSAQVTALQSQIQALQAKVTALRNAGYGSNDPIKYDSQGNIIPKIAPTTSQGANTNSNSGNNSANYSTPGAATTTKSTPSTSSASNGSPNTLKSGDTLANIAVSHNMTAVTSKNSSGSGQSANPQSGAASSLPQSGSGSFSIQNFENYHVDQLSYTKDTLGMTNLDRKDPTGDTIAKYGCNLASLTMMANYSYGGSSPKYTIPELNNQLEKIQLQKNVPIWGLDDPTKKPGSVVKGNYNDQDQLDQAAAVSSLSPNGQKWQFIKPVDSTQKPYVYSNSSSGNDSFQTKLQQLVQSGNGTPVEVEISGSHNGAPQTHYVVVYGFDSKGFRIADPDEPTSNTPHYLETSYTIGANPGPARAFSSITSYKIEGYISSQ